MYAKRVFTVALMIVLTASLAIASEFPAGTRFTVRVSNELSSGHNHAGDAWEGVLTRDVVVKGKVVARAGSTVRGKVTDAKSSGRLKAPGILSVRLTSVNGKAVSTGSLSRKGKSHTKSNATKIGGGAAAGALIDPRREHVDVYLTINTALSRARPARTGFSFLLGNRSTRPQTVPKWC